MGYGIDDVQEEADMWHDRYNTLLEKIEELTENKIINHSIVREEEAWQKNVASKLMKEREEAGRNA